MDWINTHFQATISHVGIVSFLLAYLAGVMTSATPCIYPMIPITVGIIGAQKTENRWQGFVLSVVYVFGMALVYAVLGIIAASTGKLFGSTATNPWVYFGVGNLCLFFAAWMMGWVNIPQVGVFSALFKDKQKSILTVFLMGGISGLVAAPCTAPALAMLLTYVATTGSMIKGGLLLFIFAFGMGTLLIVLGTFVSTAKILPKPGEWMVRVKQLLALIMLGAGEYFLVKMGELLL